MARGQATSLADRAARGAQALKPGEGNVKTVKDMVASIVGDVGAIAPRGVDPNRILELAYTAMREDPKLMDCTAASLVGGLTMSIRLGLEIGGPLGQSYLVPFRNTQAGVVEATWMLGYRGMIHLAYKSGQIENLAVVPVWPEDRYQVELGSEWRIVHIPDIRAPHDERKARPIAYYMRAKLKGGEAFVLPPLSAIDIERHRQWSKGKNSPAWTDHYVAMASKTVVREDARYLPLSVETADAFATDDSVVRADNDGLTIDTTARPVEPQPEPPARETVRASRDPAPSEPPPSRDPVGTEAPSQDADPRDLLRQQLGRLKIGASALNLLLAPFEAVDVAGLKAADARRLADVLGGIEAKGEDAAREAVERMGGDGQ